MKKSKIGRLLAVLLIVILIIGVQSSTIFFKDEFFIDEEIPLGMFISAKEAGMIPNDQTQAKKNGNLFIKALNKYGGIVIDDTYYIGTPSEELTTRNVEITGTENGELISAINASTILFNPEEIDNITIKDIKFTNNNEVGNFLLVYNPAQSKNKVETVLVENCTFEGNISLCRQFGNTTLDPDITDYGIDSFTFRNNKVFDTGLSFIVLADIPVSYCKVSNNVINNFNYTFLNISISNGKKYEQDLYNHIGYLEVDTNTVTCEDDWWGKTALGSYYTFVLYEGTEVLYNNNHVEGMKALEDIALYDAYLSAEVVNYTNNTWKNNICFAPDKTNNTLLKSKGGGEKPLIRNYSNNTFIVEEDFAERLGQPKENLKVDFISLTQYAETYRIDNNVFDVYDIRFQKSSLMISNYIFTNNTLKAQKASGKLAIVRLKDDYATDKIEIVNNDIEINEKIDEQFTLVRVIDNREKSSDIIESVLVNDNKITAPFGFLFYGLKANNLEFRDNEIIDNANIDSKLIHNSESSYAQVLNNTIAGNDLFNLYEISVTYETSTQIGPINKEDIRYFDSNNPNKK
jgi:hypothetical protein